MFSPTVKHGIYEPSTGLGRLDAAIAAILLVSTSTALYDSKTGEMVQQKKLLPVKEGQLGLRQSDAVFHHTAQLHTLIEELLKDVV